MTMTAYNEDIQYYTAPPSKPMKTAIINEVKEIALREGINFNSLFPANTKRYQVLDEIVYLLSAGGICTIESKTLANRVGASVRTVNDAVSKLKQLGSFMVCGLANGKNKYVFVYKLHKNFNEILQVVFRVKEIDNAEQITEQIAEQENAESVGAVSVNDDIDEPISLDLYLSKDLKQEINNNNAREAIENNIVDSDVKNFEQYINEQQKVLYELMQGPLMNKRIRDNAKRIALRAGSNCNEESLSVAMKAVTKIDRALFMGIEIESVPAYFDKIYKDRLMHREHNAKNVKEVPVNNNRELYFDWTKNEESNDKHSLFADVFNS